MADNTTLSTPVGDGDEIRLKDRGTAKTQVIGLDINVGGATEKLLEAGQQTSANSIPVVLPSDQVAPVAIADGSDVTLGAKADSAATTDTGTFSLIAFVKRLLQRFTSLLSLLPSALTVGGSFKTAIQEPLPTGTNSIGQVTQGTSPWVTSVTGNVNVVLQNPVVDCNQGESPWICEVSAAGGSMAVTGPLTNAELRGDPVSVSIDDVTMVVPVNGAGGTFPVTDSGGSLTVDAPVSTPVFVRLSDGASPITTLAVSVSSSTYGGFTAKTADFDTDPGDTDLVPLMGIALPGSTGAVIGGTSNNPVRIDPTGTTTQPVSIAATVVVTGAGGTFPITDSGGSLTVDAPVGTPVFVRLSDGTNPITTLPVSIAATVVVTGAGGTFPVTDSGGSLTVDAPVGTPVFVRLSDGTNPLTTLPVSIAATVTVTGAGGTFPVTDSGGSLTVDAAVSAPVFVRLSDGTSAITNLGVNVSQVGGNSVSTAASGIMKVGLCDGSGTALPSKLIEHPTVGNFNALTAAAWDEDGGKWWPLSAGTSGALYVEMADYVSIGSGKYTDFDTSGGTEVVVSFGIALPGSGGAVIGGTSTNPIRTDPTGTTTQPVSIAATVTVTGAGGTFPVTDSGGSLTVDAPATAPVFIRLSDGSAAINAATDRTTAASPFSVRLTDGSAFYAAPSTSQFPSALVSGRLDVNVGNTPTVSQSLATAIVAATSVTVNTSATQLTSNVAAKGVLLTALTTNSVPIYLGGSGVTVGNGLVLYPGATAFLEISNTNLLYHIAGSASQSLAILVL